MQNATFTRRVLAWYDKHGRHDLPWQLDMSPYRVWVSEIMLQQTQVATVIPYFHRFMQTFPSVDALAAAQIDQVLHAWTGLGYYARARNLHKSAVIICNEHSGMFPTTLAALETLPGIGRSTAGAILSLSHDVPATILDGNVKRVLARFAAIEGWPGTGKVHDKLWDLANHFSPKKRCRDYTQAMMDLGATVCTRTRPLCDQCPLQSHCKARLSDTVLRYPGKKPKKEMPVKKTILLLVKNDEGDIFLEKRPATGIWGSLWSLPEFSDLKKLNEHCQARLGFTIKSVKAQAPFRHTFSHYHLDITPVYANLCAKKQKAISKRDHLWYNCKQTLGLAAPVKKLLSEVLDDT